MIIHGGINPSNNQILDDTWVFNFVDGKWSQLNFENNSSIIPRYGYAAVVVNEFMFIIGGLTNPNKKFKNKQKCFCVNLENFHLCDVNLIGNFLPGHSMLSAAVSINDTILLFGKLCSDKNFESTPLITYITVPIKFSESQSFSDYSLDDGSYTSE